VFTRLLAASLISVTAFLGCSSDPKRPGSAVASAGADNASAGGATAGNTSSAGSGPLGGSGPILDVDPDAGIDQGWGSPPERSRELICVTL
jgi:hypothetical protein